MEWSLYVVFLSYISVYADAMGLENLTFFGEYVVFKPKTHFIKFDLLEEMDILLLEHRTNKVNVKLRDTDYLYRIRLIMDDGAAAQNIFKINCTIQRKGGEMKVAGQYQLWNLTEKNNMALSWGFDKRVIEVLTELDGNHNNIFSWNDRSRSRPNVKYVGLAVSSSPKIYHNETDHRHLNWKIREAEPADVDIRHAYKICDVKLLSANPRNTSLNATSLYQISVTREDDENFLMSLQKRGAEVLRATSTRMDCEKIAISWDAEDKVMCLGIKDDTAPIVLWQDADNNEDDFNNIKYVHIVFHVTKKNAGVDITKDAFKTIPELFPRYFTSKQPLMTTATTTVTPQPTMKTWTSVNAVRSSLVPSSNVVPQQNKNTFDDNSSPIED